MEPTKLKIKSQSPSTRCEICHKTDCFDPNTGSCSRCSVLMQWQELTKIGVYSKRKAPIGIVVKHCENELILERCWYDENLITIFKNITIITAFVLPIIMPLMVVISIMIETQEKDLFKFVTTYFGFFIFVLSFSIIPLYYLIALYKNTTSILVNNKRLVVEHKPLPWLGSCSILIQDLDQIYVKKVSNEEGEILSYQLWAKLKDGKDIKLISNIVSEEVGHFLEQQIENYLGIVDEPIQGEVPK